MHSPHADAIRVAVRVTRALRLSQIALSVSDVRRSQRWYRDVLGLEPGGGTNLFAGPLSSMVQGVPRSASTCWWLVDRQDLFQVELFEFRSPLVREVPPDWRPCDIGYTTVSFWVDDLDAAMGRAREAGSERLTEPIGEPGERRVCLRDPDGVLVELMEQEPRSDTPRERPRAEIGVVARAVTLSVPDLRGSRRVLRGDPGAAGGGGPRAASSRARGAVGPGRGEERARVPVGRRLPGRARLVLGSLRARLARGLPDQRPGAPQHRVRLSQPPGVR